MMTKTKTIKMLLYDGSLNGVTNISDSAWESGKMYSAPRESINNLVTRADCKRYGVYLLLSDQMVYVGQASDLERRTKQHLSDKEWWTQIVLMTTKDDSFNSSDIDYLESRLIDLANKAGTSDSDNKKRGNRQKVDEFRQAELEQYLDEALFLLELIGVRVFKRKSTHPPKQSIEIHRDNSVPVTQVSPKISHLPALPDPTLKIGAFVFQTMSNLSESGFTFATSEIEQMCTAEWSSATFHTKKPFMKRYVDGVTDTKGADGYVRFRAKPLAFGTEQVLITKEWFEWQRDHFVSWYKMLCSSQA